MSPNVALDSEAGAFAIRLREVRETLGLTQQAFADKLGVSRSFLSDVETLRSKPSFDLILGLAHLPLDHGMRLDREWLLTGAGKMFPLSTKGASRVTRWVSGFDQIDWELIKVVMEQIPHLEQMAGRPLRGSKLRAVVTMIYDQAMGTRIRAGGEPPFAKGDDAREVAAIVENMAPLLSHDGEPD